MSTRVDLYQNSICRGFRGLATNPVSVASEPSNAHAKEYKICDCGGEIYQYKECFLCEECGMQIDASKEVTDLEQSNYNTNSNAPMAFKITGGKSNIHQRIHAQVTADYAKTRNRSVKYVFEKARCDYTGEEGLPKEVFNRAVEFFDCIQEHGTRRSNIRRGLYVGCLYYAANEMGYHRKIKIYAAIFKTSVSVANRGVSDFEKYMEKGIITVDEKCTDFENYHEESSVATKYLKRLKISLKYRKFILDIIERCDEKDISTSAKPGSKCAGIIHLITQIDTDLKEKAKLIPVKCDNITKSTYMKVFNAIVEDIKKFKKVLRPHGFKFKTVCRRLGLNRDGSSQDS